MKKLALALLVLVYVSMLSKASFATTTFDYDDAWTTNSNMVMTINYSFLPDYNSTNSFFIYDIDEGTDHALELFSGGSSGLLKPYVDAIYFETREDGMVCASLSENSSEGTKTLELGSDGKFGFYFLSDEMEYTSYSVQAGVDAGFGIESYLLTGGSPVLTVEVIGADPIRPVFIPSSMLLLSSGLVGLVCVRRRYKQ